MIKEKCAAEILWRICFILVAFFLNYYVFELVGDYRYALIGSKSSKYLWILSRTSVLIQSDMDTLLNKTTQRGYNTIELIGVEQVIE